jgi:hypothetical protein
MTATKRAPRSAADRRKRNTLIVDLFLTGLDQRKIGAHPEVRLSASRVNDIIKAELKRIQSEHVLRNVNAMTIWLARHEMLIRAALVKVAEGELKAIEPARRLQVDVARMFGLLDDDAISGVASVPPISDNELADTDSDDDATKVSDLERYRAQRSGLSG